MTNPAADALDPRAYAQRRRQALCARLERLGLDAALLTDARDIMYFTGAAICAPAPACLLVRRAGDTVLVRGEGAGKHHVDETLTYPWHTGGTLPCDPASHLAACAGRRLRIRHERIGVQRESACPPLLESFPAARWLGIDQEIVDIERTKDELDLNGVAAAIRANLGAYEAVRGMLRPDVTELEVFAAGWRGATMRAGTKVVHDGDYRCGEVNGPARNRRIEAGELYIVDAWTQHAGYWSDLARVFSVSSATRLQHELISHIDAIHERVLPLLRPGTSGDRVWHAVDAAVREFAPLRDIGLPHHAGHGIGIRIHEPPDINPGVTDVLRAGDVICLEPGGYLPAARAGARIEQMYLVTERGARCLSLDD